MKKNKTWIGRLNGYWRVDGVSDVLDFDGRFPRTKICLSQIDTEKGYDYYNNHALTGKAAFIKYALKRIRHFPIGSVWKDGELAYSSPVLRPALKVNVDGAFDVRLGQEFELNGNTIHAPIPQSHYQFGNNFRNLSNNLLKVVPIIGNENLKYLLIPHSELFRFYFGVSDRLATKIALGEIGDLVNMNDCKRGKDSPILSLKKPLYLIEQFVLFRALATNEARAALRTTHRHFASTALQNASGKEKKPLIIQSDFPFRGMTNLTVSGKKVPMLKQGSFETVGWAVFAMNILNCTKNREFYGESVVLDAKSRGQKTGEEDNPGNSKDPQSTSDMDEDELEENDESADKRIRRAAIYRNTNQFSAMDGWRPNSSCISAEKGDRLLFRDYCDPLGITSEDGNYTQDSKGNLGKSEYDTHDETFDRKLSDFIRMIEKLRFLSKDRKWMVETRRLNDNLLIENEFVTAFPRLSNKRLRWYLIERENGLLEPRKVVWVEIKSENDEFIYILEMETKSQKEGRSSLVIKLPNLKRMDTSYFSDFLKLTAIQNGWPHTFKETKSNLHERLKASLSSGFELDRIRHPTFKAESSDNAQDNEMCISRWSETAFVELGRWLTS